MSVEDELASFDRSLITLRAEYVKLLRQRAELATQNDKIAAQVAAMTEAFTELRQASDAEFIRRCIAVGIDKFSIAELRERLDCTDAPHVHH